MNANAPNTSDYPLGEVTITSVLRVEHRLLRVMMEAMAEWLAQAPPAASAEMRQRAGLLTLALEVHARREERNLFHQLGPRSELARHLVDMMVIVHDEVRSLAEELETASSPKDNLWTILDITETHFKREDEEVFPLADALLPRDLLLELAARG